MGITTVNAILTSLDQKHQAEGKFMVDTGAAYTIVPQTMAQRLALKPTKTQKFSLADGSTVTRKLSHAMIEINGDKAPSTVVIGEPGDAALLGAITLENMGLMVDPFKRQLRPMNLMLG